MVALRGIFRYNKEKYWRIFSIMRFSTVSDGRVMAIIIIEEILMANGLAVLMAGYLLHCRRKNRESLHTEDKIYDGIALVNILGALSETVAFSDRWKKLYWQQTD